MLRTILIHLPSYGAEMVLSRWRKGGSTADARRVHGKRGERGERNRIAAAGYGSGHRRGDQGVPACEPPAALVSRRREPRVHFLCSARRWLWPRKRASKSKGSSPKCSPIACIG